MLQQTKERRGYKIGQLYMISKHRNEQSGGGEGVEVVRNQPDTHPQHGLGQLTEKRIYLNSKLPSWVSVFVPRVFYVTEKAWNFYPYTITGLTTLFYPPNTIRIETRFENNNGDNSNVSITEGEREGGDLSRWDSTPIMCSYKRVQCSFEVYGFQGKTEDFIHRDILLVGHRQAVAWTDEWHGQ
uniref:Phosphatidylinositol transfer protein cytoplasmic 1b n=1 Tax=Hucho hucho TaxID=62062 RepID=A0A4W5PTE2_9TELE